MTSRIDIPKQECKSLGFRGTDRGCAGRRRKSSTKGLGRGDRNVKTAQDFATRQRSLIRRRSGPEKWGKEILFRAVSRESWIRDGNAAWVAIVAGIILWHF